ncbi:MAG: hypothetical protein KIT11_11215 [Fimbriimonadaceae bacterium]|nr:hypothetical protein [Fimbriimonadaceae bacterium]QYK55398.1 MAG: hypothetical protein KF733_10320 [Fimbriimonadaceae bacterium]
MDLAASDFTTALSFPGEEGLYTGIGGQKVVADCDGPGLYKLCGPVVVEADGAQECPLTGRFDDFVVARRAQPGLVTATLRSRPVPRDLSPIPFDGRWEGCGWALRFDAPTRVDGEDVPRGEAAGGTPVFRSLEGKGLVAPLPGLTCALVQTLDLADPMSLEACGWTAQNASQVQILASETAGGGPLARAVQCHLNRAVWSVPVPTGCLGLRLRRLYDRFHGRQRARIMVDGAFARWWYDPAEDRNRRWGWSETGVDADALWGKGEVALTIDPPAGTALWSWSKYEVFALCPAP